MSDAQQARESAAGLVLLLDKLQAANCKSKVYHTRSALQDCLVILNTEHDRLIEEAEDLESEGEGA